MSQSPPSRHFMPAIPSLEVYTEEGARRGTTDLLSPEDTRHQVVERVIHLALCLLETRQGRESLVDVATTVIQERNRRRIRHIYNRRMEDLPGVIDFFLGTMRDNFPMTYLVFADGGEASAMKQGGTDIMENFSPKLTGRMTLNRVIIDNMVDCLRPGQPATAGYNYLKFKFQMQISVAHEIVHFLTAFLTGSEARRSLTPSGVSMRGFTSQPSSEHPQGMGESGRYWEGLLLGGVAEFYHDPADPME
ncbi:hypothetical protein B0H63DRAFT_511730 [Podospora didyma]|uniref:Uncharacterized protein n=1 Tax=Podospora didyma TaxID=330526 RepID=A0AAE0KJ33_9PEZI|nr:hypothetical protein B0H63DRAFT_511730 [Podospora didyma]